MKAFVSAALAALVLASAGGVQAKNRDCDGFAEAADGSDLLVTFTVDKAGTVVSREASWSPPFKAIDGATPTTLIGGSPELSVRYSAPTAEGLGAPYGLMATLLSIGTPPEMLKGGKVVLTLGEQTWSSDMFVRGSEVFNMRDRNLAVGLAKLSSTQPQEPVHPDLLALLDAAVGVTVGADISDGRRLGAGSFDFSDHAARDALFRQAWAAAEKAAETPRKCKAS
ncbi:hypothetical protein [Caulobacter sp. 17J65-9]|uniref:hypothetical protein n=1 Tax=Caulobacter sp. 17J65-9 TaxID=2709382 RepID=UPI0013CAD683|nr:hypothetical protein [Caulobacter sp. 17J65-9]NEX92133.1 hypothetical protein [Caulobacter sp. 17J65-9]